MPGTMIAVAFIGLHHWRQPFIVRDAFGRFSFMSRWRNLGLDMKVRGASVTRHVVTTKKAEDS
jgi:hypothetical protein